ncbi:aldehyde dehydrogenase [Verminephrobacter aporrectodeae subsp. tuberculatae]|uniref:Aldehyde dehydrogenase n=1 Tax=Verminephrobacter aporrectodeae subsp. tuberculatae TaxID=1110392 RepID=A0ABT3KR56_9BURK|nr:aldehyde dehydrogenase [Verminephrobacter aporrectodeae]MCW5220445.1 aldehyde dehydrogenase [Verminephrobacter aporrectodeae subsp. tuberculatae]MCW5255600.1 aldehyde dehydrogenase [Verminephrobacter aporrectodeae subsp. tuberculatae]MCW5289741.1 aldehyde dehydrogenase [Verminephrobacter aporrectodeae subsp. tuberculatae]MCW5320617.1 aldehyde dehydrogenase [Verminephrobacter aporrectodeae subsp. tuberculatae]MCW8165953.1 aldehyde dehydrogenase [Verminephrobacter aporrectodeae subsp. tubercu
MKRYQLCIAGQARDSRAGAWFETQNPFTGESWAEIPRGNAQDVDMAVQAAHQALTSGPWADLTHTQRGALLRKLGDLIARDAARLAATEVRDNGKLLAEMQGQLNYIPQWFYYYGGLADKVQGSTLPLDKKGYFAFTRHEPVGVVAAITPWNSPLLLLAWKIAPALAAGCTIVVKPSEFTSASTLEFAQLFEEAGFPPGVFNVVTGFGAEVGMPLVEHPLVAKISFTGSDATGRLINEKAARLLKHTTMELGGKSPNVVFEDADLEQAVFGAISGVFAATGQTCIAGSRLLVQDSIHDAFVEKLLAVARCARMGDPMHPDTQVGPVTTPAQYQKVLEYIDIARAEGATAVLGGGKGTGAECGNGWFVQPTIFTGVTNGMRIAQEEVFGPVLSVIRFQDEEDALRIANGVRFGLAAAVWTKDIGRAIRMSEKLQAGTVWVNTYRAVSFMAPFGGYKDSGIGRENGMDAIREYLQTKAVWINSGAVTGNPFVLR